MKKIKLNPKCFETMQFAITNTGELIPCCYCDSVHTRGNPVYERLLAVSKIDDYEKIEDILETEEWQTLYKNLKNDIGLPACVSTCRAREESTDIVKKESIFDPVSNKVMENNV